MEHVIPSLKVQKPETIVIHVGGNDINSKKKYNVNVNKLTHNIISLALCLDFGIPDVVILELLPKKSIVATSIIRKMSDWVRELCKNNNFYFIYHPHITTDFLDYDRVHLTDTTAEILADNMVDYINNFILTQNLPNNEENTRSGKWSFRNKKQEFVKGNFF